MPSAQGYELMKGLFMKNAKGFTFLEVIIVLSILSLLSASIALPAVIRNIENAKAKVCAENRRVIEHAEQRFLLENYRHSKNMQELVDEGYLRKMPECPSGGVYAWTSIAAEDPDLQSEVGCSVHSVAGSIPVAEPPVVEPPVVEPPVVEPPVVEPPVVEPPVVEPPADDKGKDKGKDEDKGKDKDKGKK